MNVINAGLSSHVTRLPRPQDHDSQFIDWVRIRWNAGLDSRAIAVEAAEKFANPKITRNVIIGISYRHPGFTPKGNIQSRWTDEAKDLLKTLWDGGAPLHEIQWQVGFSASEIFKQIKRMGLHHRKEPTPELIKAATDWLRYQCPNCPEELLNTEAIKVAGAVIRIKKRYRASSRGNGNSNANNGC